MLKEHKCFVLLTLIKDYGMHKSLLAFHGFKSINENNLRNQATVILFKTQKKELEKI